MTEQEQRLMERLQRRDQEIERLRAALAPFADCGNHLGSQKFTPNPDTGIWVPRTTHDPQPPCILVRHLLAAAKALPGGSGVAPIDTPPPEGSENV